MKKIILCFILITFLANGVTLEEVRKSGSTKEEVTKIRLTNLNTGEKRFNEIRSEINEPIETRVFKNLKEKNKAIDEGFENSKKRLAFLLLEESEVKEWEKKLGIDSKEENRFNGVEFKKVYSQYASESNSVEKLQMENQKMYQYLERLNSIESELKK